MNAECKKLNHGISCSILAVSREILSNGFLNLVQEGAKHAKSTKNQNISSIELCKLCHTLLSKKKETIIDTLQNKMKDYCGARVLSFDICDYLLTQVTGFMFTQDGSQQCHQSSSEVHNNNGRSYHINIGVGRNRQLLQENCFASVLKSTCDCHESIILVEYVTLAWSIAMISQMQDRIGQDLSLVEVSILKKLSNIPLNSNQLISLQIFQDNFQHGLCDDILYESTAQSSSTIWTLQNQVLMCVISSVCSFYSTHYYSKNIPTNNFNIDSITIFNVLCRIPMNIHAIYAVISSENTINTNESIIEQKRLGFGLFITASSVNHSCNPNCAVRYQFNLINNHNSNNINNSDNNISLLNQLNQITIQLIATQSIANNSEITISYGPLQGCHSYHSRQEFLQTQFLFQCNCGCCMNEFKQMSLNHSNNSNEKQIITDETELNQSNQSNEEKTIYLCKEIERLQKEIIIIINSKDTKLFINTNNNNNNSFIKLQLFNNNILKPFHNSLKIIQNIYYNPINHKKSIIWYNFGTIDSKIYLEFIEIFLILLDLKARILIQLNEYNKAIDLIEQSIELMINSGKYSINDIIISRENVKLSQLYYNSGNIQKAMIISQKAINNMTAFVSENDPDWIEAQCIVRFAKSMNINSNKSIN